MFAMLLELKTEINDNSLLEVMLQLKEGRHVGKRET